MYRNIVCKVQTKKNLHKVTHSKHVLSWALPRNPGGLRTINPNKSTITNQFRKWQCLSRL